MATWKLQVTHALAHIEPTLSVGTAGTNNPKGNIRTLDPNVQSLIDAAVGAAAQLRFDRGATMTNYEVNSVAVINHNWSNFSGSGGTFTLYTGTSAGATTNNRYSVAPGTRDPLFSTFTSDANQHIRMDIGGASFSNILTGVITVGTYYDLGNPVYGEVWGATSPGGPEVSGSGAAYLTGTYHGARTVNAKFRKVTRTNAAELLFWYHQGLIAKSTSITAHILAGIGGGGGAHPVVLVDDQGEIYYGPAQITATSWGGRYVELDVRLTEIPYRKLYT